MDLVYRQETIRVLQVLKDYRRLSKNRTWIRNRLKEVVSGFDELTPAQKKKTYDTVLTLAYYGSGVDVTDQEIKEVMKVVNKNNRHNSFVVKNEQIRETMRDNRTDVRYPTVIYSCDTHGNAAEDHKDYQGKLYYDRFWRSILERANVPEFMIKRVERFIKDNKLLPLQYIIGAPVYLCTRPYCRHKMYPVPLLDVLTSSTDDLIIKNSYRRTKRGQSFKDIKKKVSRY